MARRATPRRLRSFLTDADLVVRLGVPDALELELVERLGELPLGGGKI